jgi:hypothetical protein
MGTALKAMVTTTNASAKGGWRATLAITGGSFGGSGSVVVDPIGGVALSQANFAGEKDIEYAVQRKGTYTYLNESASRSAVKMMGRPSVWYRFTAQKSLNLTAYANENLPTAASLASEADAGTKTTHDDGSIDYVFTDDEELSFTLRLNPAGVLSSVAMNTADVFKMTLTYAYGAQRVTLPSAAVTVDAATLAKAEAYLTMPARVKKAADKGAAHTRSAAKRKTVKVAALRKLVRKDVAAANKAAGGTMIKVKNVTGGVRVYATNPWTKKTVAYTVKAAKKKVVVKKA